MADFWKYAIEGLPQGQRMGMFFAQMRQQKEERDEQRREARERFMIQTYEKNPELYKLLAEEYKMDLGLELPTIDGQVVTPERARLWNLAKKKLTPEEFKLFRPKFFGIDPTKPTAIKEKFDLLTQLGATTQQKLKAFGGYIETKKPQIIEIGVEGQPHRRQKVMFDFEQGKITKRIGKPYSPFAPKKGEEISEWTEEQVLKLMRSRDPTTGLPISEETAIEYWDRSPKTAKIRIQFRLQYGRDPNIAKEQIPFEKPPTQDPNQYKVGWVARNQELGTVWRVVEHPILKGTKTWQRVK